MQSSCGYLRSVMVFCLFLPACSGPGWSGHIPDPRALHIGYVVLTAAGVYVCYVGLSRQSCPFWFGIGAAGVNVARAVVFHSQPLASWPGGDNGPGMAWAWIMMPATFWIGVSAVLVLVPYRRLVGRTPDPPNRSFDRTAGELGDHGSVVL